MVHSVVEQQRLMLGMLLLFFITVTITGYTKYFDLKKKNKKIKEPLELTNLSAGGDFKISIKQLDHQSRYHLINHKNMLDAHTQ